jgi:hypothetical protein
VSHGVPPSVSGESSHRLHVVKDSFAQSPQEMNLRARRRHSAPSMPAACKANRGMTGTMSVRYVFQAWKKTSREMEPTTSCETNSDYPENMSLPECRQLGYFCTSLEGICSSNDLGIASGLDKCDCYSLLFNIIYNAILNAFLDHSNSHLNTPTH